MVEYSKPFYGLIGILGIIIWSASYWGYFRKTPIYGTATVSAGRKIGKLVIFLVGVVAWVLLTYSMLGPRKPTGTAKQSIEVNDIYFVVDLSRSMMADDFYPNRLEAAKSKILEFVNLRPTDRIGIIIFAEKVFTLLPLSTDLQLVKRMVSQINMGVLGNGTNIGDALGLAVGRISKSLAKNKVIILLTDGVSNVGNMTPLQAAEEAHNFGIKVYTIGIGGKADAKIPLSRSGQALYQNIPGGSVDFDTLMKISKMTNAEPYIASNDSALSDVLSRINKLEKTKIKKSNLVLYDELYWKPLFYGLLLIVLVELGKIFLLREVL